MEVQRTAACDMTDIDGPSHYGGADNPYEAIKVMRAWMTKDEVRE